MRHTTLAFTLAAAAGSAGAGCSGRAPARVEHASTEPRGSGGRAKPPEVRDRDGDGVPDDRDRCDTPRLPQTVGNGELRRFVNAQDGCADVTMPAVCHGDQAPPRMILGVNAGQLFINGATVRLMEHDGHKVLGLRIEADQDADLVEDCPEMAAYLTAVVKIGDDYREWTCEARETKKSMVLDDGPHIVRELTIDDANPCTFDPARWGISDSVFSTALASGEVYALLHFHAKDGAGNLLTTNLGGGAVDGIGTCGFWTKRNGYDQLADSVPLDCGGVCTVAPGIALGVHDAVMPPVPPGLGGQVVVASPNVQVTQRFTVSASASCDPPVVTAFATSLRVGTQLLAKPQAPVPCAVTPGPGPSEYVATCTVQPPHLAYTPGSDAIVVELAVAVRTGDQLASTTASFWEGI